MDRTLEVPDFPLSTLLQGLEDAIDRAADQDQMTWLTDHGKKIAAIVPVEQAERGAIRP
jgi:antitoxin (DNA-binding transcriptional repressor) of toxin-antitoxin stability system